MFFVHFTAEYLTMRDGWIGRAYQLGRMGYIDDGFCSSVASTRYKQRELNGYFALMNFWLEEDFVIESKMIRVN